MTKAKTIAALVASYAVADAAAREEMDVEIDLAIVEACEICDDAIESIISTTESLICIMESGREITLAADGSISE